MTGLVFYSSSWFCRWFRFHFWKEEWKLPVCLLRETTCNFSCFICIRSGLIHVLIYRWSIWLFRQRQRAKLLSMVFSSVSIFSCFLPMKSAKRQPLQSVSVLGKPRVGLRLLSWFFSYITSLECDVSFDRSCFETQCEIQRATGAFRSFHLEPDYIAEDKTNIFIFNSVHLCSNMVDYFLSLNVASSKNLADRARNFFHE